jgi:hypothetical protein
MGRLAWSAGIAAGVLGLASAIGGGIRAQGTTQTSCDDWLLPLRDVNGKTVGAASCLVQETTVTVEGVEYTRLDIGLDGTLDGYMTKDGPNAPYSTYVTQDPDLVYPQSGDPGPVYRAIATYERDKGAAMTLVFPKDQNAWNGKMFVTAHGGGPAFVQGTLKPWNQNVDPADPAKDLSRYDRLAITKGYALVKTRRTATQQKTGQLGDITAVLEDGTRVENASFNDSPGYAIDFALIAKNAVTRRLGRAPSRAYLYGHSSGARMGRGINYTPGLNRGPDGKPVFDGFLVDDSGGGAWLPIVMKDGKDVLFATDADKAAFVPQLEVAHQMYNNIWLPDAPKPDWMSSSYLENKRNNAVILREKGLWTRFRMYEVRNFSHSTGVGDYDLAPLMDTFIDLLDAWVDKGVEPPPTRSDWAGVGDTDGDGRTDHAALELPDISCPLGVYYPRTMTSGTIAFAAFTGKGLEPLDDGNVYVDMNRNGVWDYRETPSQVWQRLGLLGRGEELTRAEYEACVYAAANKLREAGFFSTRAIVEYRNRTAEADIRPTAP